MFVERFLISWNPRKSLVNHYRYENKIRPDVCIIMLIYFSIRQNLLDVSSVKIKYE